MKKKQIAKKMKYDDRPSSLVKGKTKGQLHREIMSGEHFDKYHKKKTGHDLSDEEFIFTK